MSESPSPSSSSLTPSDFRDAIGRFASGVAVITTSVELELFGTSVSAVTSLSDTPPMVLVCLNNASSTRSAIATSGRFALNILREDQGELAARFATKAPNKFDGVPLHDHSGDLPLLAGALAMIECAVHAETDGGTHTILVAIAQRAITRPGPPLTYFRGAFGRLHPDVSEGEPSTADRDGRAA